MRKIILLLYTLLLCCTPCAAQSLDCDAFVPICKYLTRGDSESLSVWFADNLEVLMPDAVNNASRNQAKQILKSFFERHAPRSFDVTHTAGQGNMRYLVGELNAGGETFHVVIFACFKDGSYRIQQLKIDKL